MTTFSSTFKRYYEVVEVYRRMLFAAALPILAPQGLPRAALGCVLAILAVIEGLFVSFVHLQFAEARVVTHSFMKISSIFIIRPSGLGSYGNVLTQSCSSLCVGRIYICLWHLFPYQVAVVREANPFQRESTNILLVLSQYQILLTFLSAFVVASDTLASVEGDDPLYLGFLLCGINAGILFAAGLILFAR